MSERDKAYLTVADLLMINITPFELHDLIDKYTNWEEYDMYIHQFIQAKTESELLKAAKEFANHIHGMSLKPRNLK